MPVGSARLVGVQSNPALSRSEVVVFNVNSNQSSLTISASLKYQGLTIPLQPQGSGSLTASYTGTILADGGDSTIRFPGESWIQGLDSGNWEPAPGGVPGRAPANDGGRLFMFLVVDGKTAIRSVVLDGTSPTLTVSNASFPSTQLVFTFPPAAGSTIDYIYSGLVGSGNGSEPLSGSATNAATTHATLTIVGSEQVLTIPVDISGTASAINPEDVQYRFRGQIVARAPLNIPLRITAFPAAADQIHFTVATTAGRTYTISASGDLMDWSTVLDQFTTSAISTTRTIPRPSHPPTQFFRVRQDEP